MRGPAASVAILGGGALGLMTAILVARRGFAVTVFEKAPHCLQGAGRWNEGKIHLGFTYAGDRTGATWVKLIQGALSFRPIVEEIFGTPLSVKALSDEITYLIHRDSVFAPDLLISSYEAVATEIRAHMTSGWAGYLAPLEEPLWQLQERADYPSQWASDRIVAVVRTREREVSPRWIADRLLNIAATTAGLEIITRADVQSVAERKGSGFYLNLARASVAQGPFDTVINATWESRLAIDRTAGIGEDRPWLHRYRLSLIVEAEPGLDLPSSTVVAGPFGDLTKYGDTEYYATWYPAGMTGQTGELVPPHYAGELNEARETQIAEATWKGLGEVIPAIHELREAAKSCQVRGGYIFALATGSITDPNSSLHQRSQFGIRTKGANYFSVDPGKFSMIPYIAKELATRIAGQRSPSRRQIA